MLANIISTAAPTAFEHHSLNPGSLRVDWTPVPVLKYQRCAGKVLRVLPLTRT
jgi:hypothetical protein